jgi:hypothetical protein
MEVENRVRTLLYFRMKICYYRYFNWLTPPLIFRVLNILLLYFFRCFYANFLPGFFRLLLSCDSNRKIIDLPQSINIVLANPLDEANISSVVQTPMEAVEILSNGEQQLQHQNTIVLDRDIIVDPPMIILPSADVVEVSQNFYWPLHTKPVDWIYQELVSEMSEPKRSELVLRVEHELSLLEFKRDTTSDRINLSRELLEEKEDWFNELSGGQKCKVELVRKVRIILGFIILNSIYLVIV